MSLIRLENVSLAYPVYDVKFRSIKTSLHRRLSVGGKLSEIAGKTSVAALNNVSMKIQSGDRVALIGHNGAGKSSLLRVMAGVYRPQTGQVITEGRISTLFSNQLGMDPGCTGRQNICLHGLALGLRRREIMQKEEEIADYSELGSYLDLPVSAYSQGMALRLSFAVATAIEPDILLMDEWLGAGDAKFLQKAQERLHRLVGRSQVLVLATHRLDLTRRVCNKAVLMEQGKVVLVGPIDEVIERYQRPEYKINASP